MRSICGLAMLMTANFAWAAPQVQPSHPVSPSGAMPAGINGNVSLARQATVPAPTPTAAPQVGATGPQQTAVPSGEDPAAELMRLRAEQQKAWETINSNNPLSADYGKGAEGATAGTGPFEQINKILSQPAIQAYLRLFNNPVFSKAANEIATSPKRMTLLYVELGFALFMLLFRAWRFSKSTNWFAQFWTGIWTFLMFWVGASIVAPWIVLGEPYYETLSAATVVLLSFIKK